VTRHPAREPARPRPTNVDLRVSPDTGSRTVNLYEGRDYVILIASRHAPESLIDAAAKIAKGATP